MNLPVKDFENRIFAEVVTKSREFLRYGCVCRRLAYINALHAGYYNSRLWLVPAPMKRQKIAFLDVVPDNNDRVQQLVNRANKTLERRRITGQYLYYNNRTVWLCVCVTSAKATIRAKRDSVEPQSREISIRPRERFPCSILVASSSTRATFCQSAHCPRELKSTSK